MIHENCLRNRPKKGVGIALSQNITDPRLGPDALVISLGVDTFKRDPISFFKLSSDDFKRCGATISGLKLPTLFIMEGGYAV